MNSCYTVNIVSALNCEAKTIVDRFKLKKLTDKPFTTYVGEATLNDEIVSLRVLITGIGIINMATAVGWCAAQRSVSNHIVDSNAVWLNLGIAGHGCLSIGDAFIVTASQGLLSQKKYYPPQVARRPVGASACLSLNAPSSDYPESGGLDMEASAFFSAATRFSEAECVQSYKVVSDTPEQSAEHLNAKLIQDLVQHHGPQIEAYICSLINLLENDSVESHVGRANTLMSLIIPRLRATHSQQAQCEQLAKQLSYTLSDNEIRSLTQKLLDSSHIKVSLGLMSDSLRGYQPKLERA